MCSGIVRIGRAAITGLALLTAAAQGVPARSQPRASGDVQAQPVAATLAAQAVAQEVAQAVAQWSAASGIEPKQIGLVALPLGGGPALAQHNAGAAMNPASTMKLLTSVAALAVLGPDYRWRTDAMLRGRLVDGVLDGDLVLRGGGDPKFVIEDLTEFIARMRAAGLREIRGDLLIDDAIYDVGAASVQDFDGDPSQPYNVRPFGLLMNFKAVKFAVDARRGTASIVLDPPLDGVRIDNRMSVARGPCRFAISVATVDDAAVVPGNGSAAGAGAANGKAGGAGSTSRGGKPAAGAVIRVAGSSAPSCGERSVFSAVLDHRGFIEALFRAAWVGAGGRWDGTARIERGAARGAPWQSWESPRTLADVVNDVNKFSNNVMARHLLLHLAVAAGRVPATEEGARAALSDWLARRGLVFPELVVENGAGLSRSARISAMSLARVLEDAAAGPHADLMRASLPIAGVDGTMKYRLAGERIAGNAYIKTGSLAEVRTIAGYVDAASGRRYAVVLLVNGPRAEAASQVQEQFLRWVHANG